MPSDANGELRVPVWSDDGVVKPVINDDGRMPVDVEAVDVTIDINIESSDIDVPVSVDAQTQTLDVSLESSDITLPVAEQAPLSSIQAQGYGWDLSNWRKLPMLWGFSGPVYEKDSEEATEAETITVLLPEVSAGYVHIYTGIGVAHSVDVSRDIQVGVFHDPDYYTVDNFQSVESVRWVGHQCNIIVGEGDQLMAITEATASGNLILLHATGYKMKLDA